MRKGLPLKAVARVVKLVDTRDLKSLAARRTGSIPVPGTSSTGHRCSQPLLRWISQASTVLTFSAFYIRRIYRARLRTFLVP